LATNMSVSDIFENFCVAFVPEKAANDTATIQFNLSGENGGLYWVKVDKGTCASGTGAAPGTPDMTLNSSGDDWLAVSNGVLNPMNAFMAGKIKVQGNMGLAVKLQTWFKLTR
jgi:putative sterol carrier protein